MAHVNWTPLMYLSAYCTPLPAFEQAKVVYYYLLVAGDSPIYTKFILNLCITIIHLRKVTVMLTQLNNLWYSRGRKSGKEL